MKYLVYAIAASAALNGLCALLIIGTSRKPVTAIQGVGAAVTGVAAAVILIIVAGGMH